jgi:outer membrane protein OmpA-like peptidoglycan-associated protein
MRRCQVFSVSASTFTLGMAIAAMGLSLTACHAQAKVEVAAPPAPPPPAPRPPSPPPAEAAKQPPPAPKIVSVGRAEIRGSRIHIPGELEFDKGKSTINHTKDGDEILTTLVELMKTNAQITKLRVEGHTDNTGNDAANVVLSQARADAVVAWLSTRGVSPDRLVAKGYGSIRPAAPNDTDEHRKQNRRTEFHVQEIGGQPAPDDAVSAAAAP